MHDLKRRGIGIRLMAESARALVERKPGSGLYLGVLGQNVAAQAFYDARGGTCVAREMDGPFPGGGHAVALTYAWPDPSKLISE
jgi:ribosomal protein S18 acetylase RimI-like enzyme